MKRTPRTEEELTQQNVETIVQLENAAKNERTRTEKSIDHITRYCGTVAFLWWNAVIFSLWVLLNTVVLPHPFDPYPFTFLTFCVSLEAIFISLFILITQNREAMIAERRSHLDLQVNLLSEQENTKMLELLSRIARRVGVSDESDPSLEVLEASTEPEALVEQINAAMEQTQDH